MNQCLYIIRELGKTKLIMFKATVLRKIVYGRPVYVYGAKRIYM